MSWCSISAPHNLMFCSAPHPPGLLHWGCVKHLKRPDLIGLSHPLSKMSHLGAINDPMKNINDTIAPRCEHSHDYGKHRQCLCFVQPRDIPWGVLRRCSLRVSVNFSRKVYVDSDPMEEARRIKGVLGLNLVQYRWVGVVLCRGIGRLKRPVVFSADLQIGDGPR